MWECGLKRCMGISAYMRDESLLMWECGLKQPTYQTSDTGGNVTPYVGVWIETSSRIGRYTPTPVTPYVGVWIETCTL